MRQQIILIIGLCTACLMALVPRVVAAYEPACGSPTDVVHHVRQNETLSEIASRFYCVTAPLTIDRVWKELYRYNRTVAGPDPNAVPSDTVLCLPVHVDGNGWSADRCIARPQAQPVEGDKGKLAAAEGAPTLEAEPATETAPTAAGIAALETTASIPKAVVPASAPARGDKRRVLEHVSAELVAGFLAPSSPTVWKHLHGVLGVVAIGGRGTFGRVEVAPRVLLVMGQHDTNYYGANPQAQSVVGGGLVAQAGVPLNLGPFRFTPGVELGWARVRREITLSEYPFAGEVASQKIDFAIAGAFIRPEVTLPLSAKRGPVLALELGGDVMPVRLAGQGMATNFNVKVAGGVGYAF